MKLTDKQKFRIGQFILLMAMMSCIVLAFYFGHEYLKLELND